MFQSSHQIWKDAITRNSVVLAGMLAQLWALMEVFGGADAGRVPRAIHTTIMRVLRPAEAAVRRLIVIEARDVVVEPEPPRAPVQIPQGEVMGKVMGKTPRKPAQRMAFQLFDPRKRIRHSVKYTTLTPRIYVISQDAPFSPLAPQPQHQPDRPHIASAAERLITARRLVLRLTALTSALDDLPHQAKRLARWQQKRQSKHPPRFSAALRPGRPPGHRDRPLDEIDHILAECHAYALGVLSEARPDTS
jgi:hypothetical protein